MHRPVFHAEVTQQLAETINLDKRRKGEEGEFEGRREKGGVEREGEREGMGERGSEGGRN